MRYKPPFFLIPIEFLSNRQLTHTLYWAMVLIITVVSGHAEWSMSGVPMMMFIQTGLFISFSYILVLFLVPHFFYQRKFWLFGVLVILLCFIFTFMTYGIVKYVFRMHKEVNSIYVFDFISSYILFVFLTTALKLGKDLLIEQYEEIKAQKEKMQQELNFLRAQLSPHFLLNTMNNLYGLSVIKSDKLPNLMLRLSDLLRYSIYETKTDTVLLKNEILYLRDYIELQKIRMSSKVQIEVNFPSEIPENLTIVPLILVVFVENAFKYSHNVLSGKPPFIHLSLYLQEEYLVFITQNSFEKIIF